MCRRLRTPAIRERNSYLGLITIAALFMLWGCGDSGSKTVSPPPSESISPDADSDPTPLKSAGEFWGLASLDGKPAGYEHFRWWVQEDNGEPTVHTRETNFLTILRAGKPQQFVIELATTETIDGRLLSCNQSFSGGNLPKSRISAVREPGGWTVRVVRDGKTTETSPDWPTDLRSPRWISRVRFDRLPTDRDRFSYETIQIETLTPVRQTLTRGKVRSIETSNGSREARIYRLTTEELPSLGVTYFVGPAGEVLRKTAALGNSTIRIEQSSAAEVAAADFSKPVDLLLQTMIPAGRIPDVLTRERMVYRIARSGRDEPLVLPSGPTQRVERVDAQTLRVTVTARPVGGDRPKPTAPPHPGPDYLAATTYLDHRDKRVRFHAGQAAGTATDPREIAMRMESYVHEKLDWGSLGSALGTASETARSLRGDCTEHAILLAAMLRDRQIPSRVVSGFVYLEDQQAFGGHMWTEAHINGRWVSLDATIGQGKTGVGHIALNRSSLTDDAPTPASIFLPLADVLWGLTITPLINN